MRVFKFNHSNPSLFFEEASKKLKEGNFVDGHLFSNSEEGKIDIRHYKHIPGFEISVVSGVLGEDVLIEDPEEGQDVIVIRFMMESSLLFRAENSNDVSMESFSGCCMYNSKFPFNMVISKNKEVQFITVRLKLDVLRELENINWFSNENVFFNPKPWAIYETLDSGMEKCVRDLFALQKNVEGRVGFTFSEGIKLMTLFFIKVVKDRELSKELESLTVPPDILIKMKNELCKDLEHPISILDLAKQFGMSAQKLRVNFKIFFGKSANQLLQQVRYEEAERKLLYSDEKIQTIALSLGFNSGAHFTSEFKKRYLKSPLEYRNS